MSMIGPIHWTVYEGGFLERMMATFVAQDFPDTIRRTPASGDGGIDLLVPVGDGFDVHQVKGVGPRLGSKERRQIRSSWEEIRTAPRLDGPILGYRLVVPVDPTPDEQRWLADLLAESPFPDATFRGVPYWDSLAAKHPHVVDYFLAGGRERVARRAAALHAALDVTTPLMATEVATRIGALAAELNKDDPHYRYDITITGEPVEPLEAAPGAVLLKSERLDNGTYVTVAVVQKHRYSLIDSPIGGTLTIRLEDADDELREKVNAFWEFGRPLELPPGTLDVTLNAPGGLGGAFTGGSGFFAPAPSRATSPDQWRAVVVSPDDDVLAELHLHVPTPTVGQLGGAEFKLSDSHGLFDATLRISPGEAKTRPIDFAFKMHNLAGRPVEEVLPVVRLLSELHEPNEIQLRPQYGTTVIVRAPCEGDPVVDRGLLLHIDDLAFIQQRAPGTIRVPDEMDPDFATELHDHVRMLRGEAVTGTWDQMTANLHAPRPGTTKLLEQGGLLAIARNSSIELDGQEIDLGVFTTFLHSVLLAPDQPDDLMQAKLVPGPDNRFTRRAGPPPEKVDEGVLDGPR